MKKHKMFFGILVPEEKWTAFDGNKAQLVQLAVAYIAILFNLFISPMHQIFSARVVSNSLQLFFPFPNASTNKNEGINATT